MLETIELEKNILRNLRQLPPEVQHQVLELTNLLRNDHDQKPEEMKRKLQDLSDKLKALSKLEKLSKFRKKGSAKGKLIIHSEDNEHLEAFKDYMPQ